MITSVAIGPYTLFADDEHRPGQDILQNGLNYERHIRQEIVKFIPNSVGFLDVGANVGVHSISAKSVNPAVPVYCVEVSQKNVGLLLKTIVHNKISDITVIPTAMASVPTIIRSNNDLDNTSCGTTEDSAEGYPNLTAALSLDFINLPQIDFVKMDVEGYEFAVWRGAGKLFAMRPRMIFEFCPELVHRSGTNPLDQLQWLLDRGYKLIMLDYLPGIRKEFTEAQPLLDYIKVTTKWIADILAEPI